MNNDTFRERLHGTYGAPSEGKPKLFVKCFYVNEATGGILDIVETIN